MSGSVQKLQVNPAIDTICPIVINTTEAILTFKTASSVASNSNVNSQFSSCNPTDWSYLQITAESQVNKCCTNGVLASGPSNVNGYGRH